MMNTFREKEDGSGTGTCENDSPVDQGLGRFSGSYAEKSDTGKQEEQSMKKVIVPKMDIICARFHISTL